MTNKGQTMLTIALTAVVGVLMTDRMIEPAQAQEFCAQSVDLTLQTNTIIRKMEDCIDGGKVDCRGYIKAGC